MPKFMNNSVLLVIVAVCFLATGGIFVKLSSLGPINTGLYRILLSLPILLPFILYKKEKVHIKELFIIFVAGMFLALDLVLWNMSFSLTTVANANLLANMVPFTIIPISYFIYKEKIPSGFIFGFMITIVGLYVLISGKNSPQQSNFNGDLLAFATSIFYGLFLAIVYKLRDNVSSLSIMFYSAFGSLFVLIPSAIFFEGIEFPSTLNSIYPLIGLALLSQILGQGGLSYSLGKVPINLASILVLTQPVISALYALIIFNEKITIMEVLGVCIVLFGIYISKHNIDGKYKTEKEIIPEC